MAAVLLVAAGAIFAGLGAVADRADAAYLAQVKDRVLTLQGDAVGDKVSVRLKSGAPDRLQVDVGDDGSPDFNFKREKFDAIAVSAGGGDDFVLIDEDNVDARRL